ncbi:iron complex transport system ATP-binding protein [Halanaerobium saccharolyticum]|uniref:Iron complex transport system ATP-binding protein n=1 Tax=Halanaerobium saccharolyticum TaxID=43595 RepID=A0A4R6LRB5_9FIRM|nr:ABC transporter ATP-binding protein [Halanaerobium saccharolyticum]TDO86430.1 iron complex transport system ATP-binding protein [Halanaerobium saccharolyticum]
MSILETKNLSLAYGEETIIDDLDLKIPEGKITIFIGANGSGKSTLLNSMARLLKPAAGLVQLNGKNINQLSTKEVAKEMAFLPQSSTIPEGITVRKLVEQGRYPYQKWYQKLSQEDKEIVEKALTDTGMEELAERDLSSLSGGQRQRAWLAMILAQDTDTILLDEPTTYLDLSHQVDLLDLLYELNQKGQRTIIMVLHDLNLACRYADHIVAVKDKGIFAEGKPEEIIDEQVIKEVFDLSCQIVSDPVFGTPLCIPTGKSKLSRVV